MTEKRKKKVSKMLNDLIDIVVEEERVILKNRVYDAIGKVFDVNGKLVSTHKVKVEFNSISKDESSSKSKK